MSDELIADDFASFLAEVDDGRRPFRWQERLARTVCDEGVWPELVDVPTGCGKTTVIDIALFAQALRDDAPRRVVYVVDRRSIVSQAAERARHLREALTDPRGETVRRVARALAARRYDDGGSSPPLIVAELRGGIRRDELWATRPDVPSIITSTVDQVGSRLLFRGYGVSPGMRPVHAGLLANDVLFILDEVHLSEAFRQTLSSVAHEHRGTAPGLPDRWQVVHLSATPPPGEIVGSTFRLDASERDDPALAPRLHASKPIRTVLAKAPSKADASTVRAAIAKQVVEEVGSLLGSANTVGVIVNRVATAVSVASTLGRVLPGTDNDNVLLLTGRMRPVDREAVVGRLVHRFGTGSRPDRPSEPAVIVATQSIEAGVDLDLDVLVTECASLDALRQRFGRVDRVGSLGAESGGAPQTSVVVAASPQVASGATDPVYGGALAATWARLRDGLDDFGVLAMEHHAATFGTELLSPRPPAPILHPSHLDRWVQTRGVHHEPDVAHWLHGVERPADEVSVIWRRELDAVPLLARGGNPPADDFPWEARDQLVADALTAVPPLSGEALAVPLAAVRSWLLGQLADAADVADVEIGVSPGATALGDPAGAIPERSVVRWSADGEVEVVRPRSLRRGDTVVVPTSYGGLTRSNWDPANREPATDVSQAAAAQRGRIVLSLAALPRSDTQPTPASTEGGDVLATEVIRDYLEGLRGDEEHGSVVRSVLERDFDVVAIGSAEDHAAGLPTWFVVTAAEASGSRGEDDLEVDDASDATSFLSVEVGLDRHLADVGRWAGGLARACGLPSTLVGDLELAGRLHDLGKADPRFQALLRGGRRPAPSELLLAKSRRSARDRRGRRRAEDAARYPAGERHEALSLWFAERHEALLARAHDPDLVLHLVATHHGWARPFFPAIDPGVPELVRVEVDGALYEVRSDHGRGALGAGTAERFWRVVRRYGWFGAAWLEAIFRLADHRASAEEQEEGRR